MNKQKIPESLTQYAHKAVADGFPISDIRRNIIAGGWRAEVADELLSEGGSNAKKNPLKPLHESLLGILTGLISVLLALGSNAHFFK